MTTEIRLWRVNNNGGLQIIPDAKLDLEVMLENWLEEDISILADNLLVIGRQVETDFSGYIDLLCLDNNGDSVIVELKRDKTPREITAQVLDYASWVKNLSNEDITRIAEAYFLRRNCEKLAQVFRQTFDATLPDVLNESHRMLIVATRIDPASERIITYLSDTYGVDINAVTFQYFSDGTDDKFMARTFLLEPSQVEYKSQTRSGTKRKPNLRIEELQAIAAERGLERFYNELVATLEKYFRKSTTTSSLAFYGKFEDGQKVIMTLIPTESSEESGLRFHFYKYRFARFFNTDIDAVVALLPEQLEEWAYVAGSDHEWQGYAGGFQTEEEVEKFIVGLNDLRK